MIKMNPTDINIQREQVSVSTILSEIMGDVRSHWAYVTVLARHGTLKKDNVAWTDAKKSRFIESALCHIPVAPLYFVASEDKRLVMDGMQRLTALHDFREGRLHLSGMAYLPELNGFDFKSLAYSQQLTVRRYQMITYTIKNFTPEEVIADIFNRLQ